MGLPPSEMREVGDGRPRSNCCPRTPHENAGEEENKRYSVNNSTFSAIIYAILGEPGDQVWIGLRDIQQEGHFVYIDGEPATPENTGWASGEPNDDCNRGDCRGEDCGAVNFIVFPHNKANDAPCFDEYYALCEKPTSGCSQS